MLSMVPVGTPARLGNHDILHRLAVGGMGEVFVARSRGLAGVRRLVALKRLLPELAVEPGSVERFIDEARITVNLAHRNIVQVYDFGADRGSYFLTMELVQGRSLDHVFARSVIGTPLPRPLAVHVIVEMLRGLAHAHAARGPDGEPLGIVHRDVSPQNVLVSYTGDVKVMDFGIARATNRSHRTRTGIVRGKPPYMSPEQIRCGAVDARSDIYSAGVLLWELTLGRRLFVGDSDFEIARMVTEGQIARPRAIDPSYPPGLEDIVMAALRTQPEDRIATATAFADALRGYCGGVTDPTAELASAMQRWFADERAAFANVMRGAAEPATAPEPARLGLEPTVPQAIASSRPRPRRRRIWIAAPAIAVVASIAAWRVVDRDEDAMPMRAVETSIPQPMETPRSPATPAPVPTSHAPVTPVSATVTPTPTRAPEPPPRTAPKPAPSPLDQRLLPISKERLAVRLVAECETGGITLPARTTFALRIDRTGHVMSAEVVAKPGQIASLATGCMERWISNWRFLPSDKPQDLTGLLSVKLH